MKQPATRPKTARLPFGIGATIAPLLLATSLAASVLLPGRQANAVENRPAEYLRDVKPILAEHCFACHGGLRQESELRLDAISLIRRGGVDGAVVVPQKSAESLLVKAIRGEDFVTKMPPEGAGQLSEKEIATIVAWIDAGARADDELIPPDPRKHWAYNRPVRLAVPDDENPVDWYFRKVHGDAKLTAQPQASSSTLIRRASLDLVGLPPHREEILAFIEANNQSQGRAYDELIDELLSSPHYGERWGRHWMDVWRYTDWFGLFKEVRYSQKHIWRWRDWIVESLNEDAGYDQMIVEMLAADEFAGDDPRKLRATGYLARNWYIFNRNFWLDDIVQHTSKGFLGMTTNCCRCHDHKYDPISQIEYYQLRAFFEPHDVRIDPFPNEVDTTKDGTPRVYDKELEQATYLFLRGEEDDPDKSLVIRPIPPAVLPGLQQQIEAIDLPVLAYYPSLAPDQIEAQTKRLIASRDMAQQEISKSAQRFIEARDRLDAFANAESGEATGEATLIHDTFVVKRPEVWTVTGGSTEYRSDHVLHTNTDGGQQRFEAIVKLPKDFVARLQVKVVGGSTQSVGMAFDRVGSDAIGIYLSPPSRFVSVYEIADGKETYPARKTLPLNSGQLYDLTFAIQGQVLNVWVDGEFAFAHRITTPRKTGTFAITNYQAIAEYHELSIAPLSSLITLAPDNMAGKDTSPPDTQVSEETLQQAVDVAKRQLEKSRNAKRTTELELESFQLRAAAERVKYNLTEGVFDDVAKNDFAQKAAAAERRLTRWEAATSATEAQWKLESETIKPNNDAAIEKAEVAYDQALDLLDEADREVEQVSTEYSAIGTIFPKQSSGRRLALARWIANGENPLTARVAVNHVWLRHFGSPLVDSVFDFGLRSPPPRHQALLDHLAVEFVEHGWSMKYLHRTICKSHLYQMESAAAVNSPNQVKDPDNVNLWRMNTRRMEYELIRDSLLHAAQRLDLTLYGPPLPTPEAELVTGVRRTLYYRHARDDKIRMSRQFDDPSVEECYRRHETIVPQQSLVMANSEFVKLQVSALSKNLTKQIEGIADSEANAEFLDRAFHAVLGRPPSDAELDVSKSAIDRLVEQLSATNDSRAAIDVAREHFVHILFMHNDFVTIR